MPFLYPPYNFPDVILVIGTDASGKDHVTNILENMIREAGGEVEKRKRFFCGATTKEVYSTNKGFLDRAQEALFLAFYPFVGRLMPLIFSLWTRRDAIRFRGPRKKLIIVGHNGLRALAFYWARQTTPRGELLVSDSLRHTFSLVKEKTGAHVLVLDVDHSVRQQRINARVEKGLADRFDLYMLENPERSEAIEACLVKGAQELWDAKLLINNDLTDEELRDRLRYLLCT
ncbi:MAG: hypothetical protein EOM37_10955 [Proteobacteria bacterium]|nr:hypothetical protein [Pseudomonadota bacterium]